MCGIAGHFGRPVGPDVRARMRAALAQPRTRCAASRRVRRRGSATRRRCAGGRGARAHAPVDHRSAARSPTSRWAPTMARSGSATTARSTAGATTRAQLDGRAASRFRTRCDTEFILRGYEAWGIEGLLPRLRGMFAFAHRRLPHAARACRARPAGPEADRLRASRWRASRSARRCAACCRGCRAASAGFRRSRSTRISRIATCPRRARSSRNIARLPNAHRLEYDLDTGRLSEHRYWSPQPVAGARLRRAARRGDRVAAGRRPAARPVPVGRHRLRHDRLPARGDGARRTALVLGGVSRFGARRKRGSRGDRGGAAACPTSASSCRRRSATTSRASSPRSTSRSPTRRRFRRGTSRAPPSGT